jgi:hypothetical protein
MTNTRKAAAPAAIATALVAVPSIEISNTFDHVAIVKELADAESAQERIAILSKRTLGEVAAVAGRVANMGESVNETLNLKLCEKHGKDWAKIAKASPAELSEGDKTRKKAITASLESIRETIQANSGGDKAKARNILHRVKEWGMGIRTSKASNPKGNAKQPLDVWALKWDNFPTSFRRIHNDAMEGMTKEQSDAILDVHDAIAAYFKVCKISPQEVLNCTGETAWNKA